MSDTIGNSNDPWQTAVVIGSSIDGVIPVRGKVAFQNEWHKRARSSETSIKEYARQFKRHNYAVVLDHAFVLDIDVEGTEALKEELSKLTDILGPFEPGFTVVTGNSRYHIYCDTYGREIHSQDLTDHTHIKGWHSYVVGPGSVHPDTGRRYEICERNGRNDPNVLTELSIQMLDKLAARRIAQDDDNTQLTFNVGTGSALELKHPPCIRRLLSQGAPTDQEYVLANHTIARYVISAGLTDADGAVLAAEMAAHTPANHPTTKDAEDKVYNFHSCMQSARDNPDANQFNCSYIWGSKELVSVGLCRDCAVVRDQDGALPKDIQQLVRAKAVCEMQYGDAFAYCFKTYQQMHASDVELGQVGLLSVIDQSVLNTIGIFPKATGASGKGKTSGKTAVVHLVPQKYVFKRSFSDKALFYLDLPPESILFFDDRTLSEGMEELTRCVMDDFQSAKQHTSVHDGKSQTMKIPPRCMVMFTNVDSALNIQTANRTVDVTVDESAAADEQVHKLTAKRAEMGAPKYPETFAVLVCRELFRIIKEEIGPFRVVIPYAEYINWPGKSNRRNFDIFLDFVRGFAAFRCMQRPTREGVVFADVKDFEDAVKLFRSLSKTQTSKLTKRDWLVIQAIFDNGKKATMKELVEALKARHLTYYTIRDIIKGRPGRSSGLLDKVDGLSVTSMRETMQDASDTSHSTSSNEEVFTLPDDFDLLSMYDEGEAITLGDAAMNVDLNAIRLWQPLTALTDLTRFDHALTHVCQSDENGKLASIEEIDDIIERYKQQLQQQTTTLTHISESGRCVPPLPAPHTGRGDSTPSFTKTVKVSKQPHDENDERKSEPQTQNEGEKDDFPLCQNDVKAVSKQPSSGTATGDKLTDALNNEILYVLHARARDGRTVPTYGDLETDVLRDVLALDRARRWTTEQIRAAIVEITTADVALTESCIDFHDGGACYDKDTDATEPL